jgi:xanthine dehydrogenase accessory factor
MKKEIGEIITAYKEAQRNARQTALATVVHVEGSSYRRPGARMLVEDNGRMTGAISGGCLEGDALRKALMTMTRNENKLVTYNTLDDDDAVFGVQLGCNGIVHILFEPIDPTQTNHPIALLEKSLMERKDTVLVTVFSLKNNSGSQPGTCYFSDGESISTNLTEPALEESVAKDAAIVLAQRQSLMKEYNDTELTAFVELVEPPISLIIIGAGNDAMPLVEIASVLGWQITIIDGRATHVNRQRFPKAQQLVVGKPVEAKKKILLDKRTVVILMTHNYNYDLEMLGLLLQENFSYIGTLGPKKRLNRMLTELGEKGLIVTERQRDMIYGPTGLDIGAETSEEIALSVLAEIKAVLMARQGASLRDRTDAIHSRESPTVKEEIPVVQNNQI